MTRPDPVYLTTVRELCSELRVSIATIKRWIDQGAPIGVTVTPGGRVRYAAEKHELMRWRIERKKAE